MMSIKDVEISPTEFIEKIQDLLINNDWDNDRFIMKFNPRHIGSGQCSASFVVAQRSAEEDCSSFNVLVKVGTDKYNETLGNQEYGYWLCPKVEDTDYLLLDEDMMLVGEKLKEWKEQYPKLIICNENISIPFMEIFYTSGVKND